MAARTVVIQNAPQDEEHHQILNDAALSMPLLPSDINNLVPQVGEEVYAISESKDLLMPWCKAKVFGTTDNPEKVIVHYEHKKGNTNGEAENDSVELSTLQLANANPTSARIPVGFRVIAKFKKDTKDSRSFLVGTVGDNSRMENDRYLIFFDNKAVHDVDPKDVRMIYKNSVLWGEEVHPEMRNFLKHYAKFYPAWPLVSVQEGTWIAIECDGNCCVARVTEVSYFFAKVVFYHSGESERIYRGSDRICRQKKLFNQCDESDTLCEYEGITKNLELPAKALQPKTFHQNELCTPYCVPKYVQLPEFKNRSPLLRPLLFGWRRRRTNPKKQSKTPKIVYVAPCGYIVRSYDLLRQYLKVTDSNFPVTLFSFDNEVHEGNFFVADYEKCSHHDISDGKEFHSVPAINSLREHLFPHFEYVTEQVMKDSVRLDKSVVGHKCCCTDNCWLNSCNCKAKTQCNKNNTKFRYEYGRLLVQIPDVVYECNSNCSCGPQCPNRLVQNRITFPLQVFFSEKKGWGCRTLCDIPMGAFVGTYTGEVMTVKASDDAAEKSEYELCLNYCSALDARKAKKFRGNYEKQKDLLIIDAYKKGNAMRFLNHSCEPNVRVQRVYLESGDGNLNEMAFFTNSTIKAGSELTMKYNYDLDDTDIRPCACGSTKCTGRM
ncbi:unnamed protein product [Orchesella dallaii]|uniref:Histone-lysine N-methyltransferase eggless n=1 Tax=Orchesella dallaii TaxID=48710 RepID=A0ABP1R643_9HEXA